MPPKRAVQTLTPTLSGPEPLLSNLKYTWIPLGVPASSRVFPGLGCTAFPASHFGEPFGIFVSPPLAGTAGPDDCHGPSREMPFLGDGYGASRRGHEWPSRVYWPSTSAAKYPNAKTSVPKAPGQQLLNCPEVSQGNCPKALGTEVVRWDNCVWMSGLLPFKSGRGRWPVTLRRRHSV